MTLVDEERADVVRLFAEAGLSLDDCASFVGLKRDTVHKWARRHGITFRGTVAASYAKRRERYGPSGRQVETHRRPSATCWPTRRDRYGENGRRS